MTPTELEMKRRYHAILKDAAEAKARLETLKIDLNILAEHVETLAARVEDITVLTCRVVSMIEPEGKPK